MKPPAFAGRARHPPGGAVAPDGERPDDLRGELPHGAVPERPERRPPAVRPVLRRRAHPPRVPPGDRRPVRPRRGPRAARRRAPRGPPRAASPRGPREPPPAGAAPAPPPGGGVPGTGGCGGRSAVEPAAAGTEALSWRARIWQSVPPPREVRGLFLVVAMDAFAWGLAAGIIYGLVADHFAFSNTELASIGATFALFFALFLPPTAAFVNRVGPRRGIVFLESIGVPIMIGWLVSSRPQAFILGSWLTRP